MLRITTNINTNRTIINDNQLVTYLNANTNSGTGLGANLNRSIVNRDLYTKSDYRSSYQRRNYSLVI